MAWLFWPVSLAAMSHIGRYLLRAMAVLARVGGRYDPYWGVIGNMAWFFGTVSLAAMSRVGRDLLYEVAVLARIAGRYEPRWPLFAV